MASTDSGTTGAACCGKGGGISEEVQRPAETLEDAGRFTPTATSLEPESGKLENQEIPQGRIGFDRTVEERIPREQEKMIETESGSAQRMTGAQSGGEVAFSTRTSNRYEDKCMLQEVERTESGDGTLENVGIKVDGKFKSPVSNERFDTREALTLHLKFLRTASDEPQDTSTVQESEVDVKDDGGKNHGKRGKSFGSPVDPYVEWKGEWTVDPYVNRKSGKGKPISERIWRELKAEKDEWSWQELTYQKGKGWWNDPRENEKGFWKYQQVKNDKGHWKSQGKGAGGATSSGSPGGNRSKGKSAGGATPSGSPGGGQSGNKVEKGAFEGYCGRCGRKGHKRSECYSKTHVSGKVLPPRNVGQVTCQVTTTQESPGLSHWVPRADSWELPGVWRRCEVTPEVAKRLMRGVSVSEEGITSCATTVSAASEAFERSTQNFWIGGEDEEEVA